MADGMRMLQATPRLLKTAGLIFAALTATLSAALGGAPLTVLAGALGAAAGVAVAAVRGAEARDLPHETISLHVGVLLLVACHAGVGSGAPAGVVGAWQPALVVIAYPFLGHGLLHLVGQHRRVREADVLVESALVGTAAGIGLRAATSGWQPASLSGWTDAHGAFATVLVALDIALLVVALRGVRAPGAVRGPLGIAHLAMVALTTSHLLQQLAIAGGQRSDRLVELLAAVGMLALGTTVARPAGRAGEDPLLGELPPFSLGHAGVVAAALLAAPTALTVQALRGAVVSTTVAAGAALSGLILACYLVGLLRERAATEHQATHDALTRLPNRTLLIDRLDRSIARARRGKHSVGVLFVDLDRFKEVNDTYGHAAGDTLLRTVADRLSCCVRDDDTVARLAGDEFVILLPHLYESAEVLVIAQRVLEALTEPVTVAEQRMLIGASIGVAVYPDDGTSAGEVLAAADAAMYHAKESPGSRWEVFSSHLATEAQTRRLLEAGLLDGLGRDELVLHFQPIVDLTTGCTVGSEALVRWNHPERGFLLPGHFVPVAEQSDLIVLLGDKVLHEACRELRRWEELGLDDHFVSVNVSSRQFNHGLVSTVAAALRATGANPENLVIELTESTVVDNLEAVAAALEELRSLGVRAAIDDFGTGYCGLRYLSTLPVASLKIDRTFIQGMTASDAAIVAATVAMGHSLGLTLVAEGVETDEQRRFLAAQGCDRVQGYLLGRPMPAHELEDRLRVERGAPRPSVLLGVPMPVGR